MPRSKGRTGRPFLRARQHLLRTKNACYYCRQWVDVKLDGRLPMGPTYAHITALVDGGDPLNPANRELAHRRCNIIAENKRRARARRQAARTVTASRDW